MQHEFSNGVTTLKRGRNMVKIDWKTETISTTKGGKTSTTAMSREITIGDILNKIK